MTQVMKRMTLAFVAMAFLAVLGCARDSKTEGTGEYIDDTVITAKVKAAIINDPELKATEINVETFKGRVQLSGFVKSQEHINRATQVTRGVAGVRTVQNDIRLK